MRKVFGAFAAVLCASALYAANDEINVLHGTISKIDAAGHTIVIRAADGGEHTFRIVGETVVHAADDAGKLTTHAWRDLKQGTDVVAHYTKRGTEDVVLEIDHVGRSGLKHTEAAIERIDEGAKTIVVNTARGAEETFSLTDHAVTRLVRDIGKGTEKGARLTIYYAEDGGRKVVHVFERL